MDKIKAKAINKIINMELHYKQQRRLAKHAGEALVCEDILRVVETRKNRVIKFYLNRK